MRTDEGRETELERRVFLPRDAFSQVFGAWQLSDIRSDATKFPLIVKKKQDAPEPPRKATPGPNRQWDIALA